MEILRIENLVVDYGIIRALKGIDMKVEKGQIVAILGANGAGKTTLIRTISGVVKAKSGKVIFAGQDITNKEPYKIAAKKIMQSPEGRLILRGLTVEQNLKVGAYSLKPPKQTLINDGKTQATKISKSSYMKVMFDRVYAYFPILKERRKQQASTLSGGEQQMLAIGRALMCDPDLLLLDEPSLGLAPLIVKDIFAIINQIKNEGKSIFIVEQNAYQTLKIADYAYVLELGKVKTHGTGMELLQNDELIHAYLGQKK